VSDADHPELRDGILRVSLQLGTETGTEGLTMRAIARRLGISATALYQHFESKGAILRAIRFEGLARVHATVQPAFEADDPLERIRGAALGYVRFARDNPWLYCLLVDEDEEDWETMTEQERRTVTMSDELIYRAFAEGVERGRIRADVRPRAARMELWAAMHGLASLILHQRIREQHPAHPVDDLEAFIERYVSLVVRGYAA
jgi:AcrR family transcriptional regulator